MIELALLAALAISGPFDATDVGLGGRAGWRMSPTWTLEGEAAWYPADFPDAPAFSGHRIEALAGAAAGRTFGRLRPFVKMRAGVLRIAEAPRPFACILIFPPPLACALAAGHTAAALDLGGGVEVLIRGNTFTRFDLGDRMVRYPGPVFETQPRRIRDRAFFGHDLKISLSAGVRF
jgi:hypothetical protein